MSDSDSSEILSDGEEQNTRKRHYDDEAEEVDVSDLIKGINYLRYWQFLLFKCAKLLLLQNINQNLKCIYVYKITLIIFI